MLELVIRLHPLADLVQRGDLVRQPSLQGDNVDSILPGNRTSIRVFGAQAEGDLCKLWSDVEALGLLVAVERRRESGRQSVRAGQRLQVSRDSGLHIKQPMGKFIGLLAG